jgi:flagellar basal body P-ring formation protein FlgA
MAGADLARAGVSRTLWKVTDVTGRGGKVLPDGLPAAAVAGMARRLHTLLIHTPERGGHLPQASRFRRGVIQLMGLAVPCAASAALTGGVPESGDALRAAAERALRSQLQGVSYQVYVRASEPDPRLHLAQCTERLNAQIASPEIGARTTVRVSCPARAMPWTVFVPVMLEADVPVFVLRESGSRGSRLPPEAVAPQIRRIQGLRSDYISDARMLSHATLLRDVPAGTALTFTLLQADFAVRQGQAVTLLAAGPGVEVRAPARALEDGRAGGRVRVENLSSQKIVQGVVESDGLIRVTP